MFEILDRGACCMNEELDVEFERFKDWAFGVVCEKAEFERFKDANLAFGMSEPARVTLPGC